MQRGKKLGRFRMINALAGICLMGFLIRRQKRKYLEGRNKHIGIQSLDLDYSLSPNSDRQEIPVLLNPW